MGNVIDQNERIKNQLLSGNERLNSLISNNKLKLETSITRLDKTKSYSPSRVQNREYSPNRSKLNNDSY